MYTDRATVQVGERDASYEASSLALVDLTSLDRLSEQKFTSRRRGGKILASRVSIRPKLGRDLVRVCF
jgi:hypothetical protein